jgi:hypothetical protein
MQYPFIAASFPAEPLDQLYYLFQIRYKEQNPEEQRDLYNSGKLKCNITVSSWLMYTNQTIKSGRIRLIYVLNINTGRVLNELDKRSVWAVPGQYQRNTFRVPMEYPDFYRSICGLLPDFYRTGTGLDTERLRRLLSLKRKSSARYKVKISLSFKNFIYLKGQLFFWL